MTAAAAAAARADLVPYFKAIDEGRLQNINIDDFESKFNLCAAEAGDHLQFKLHKYCKLDENDEKNVSVIINLSKICYCNKAISGFTNMDRFLGCVYHIVVYLLKYEKNEEALDVFQSLSKQNKLLQEAVSKSETSRNIVNNFHVQLINSSNKLLLNVKSKDDGLVEIAQELAKASVEILRLLPKKSTPPKNLLRNIKYYFNNLKFYKDKNARIMYDCFMGCLEYFDSKFQRDQFLCYYINEMNRVDNSLDGNHINKHFKHRVNLFSIFIKETDLIKYWNLIIDFFINEIKTSNMDNVVEAYEKIRKNGSKLNMLVMSIIFNSSMQLWYKLHTETWGEKFSVEFVQRLFDGILLPLKCKLGHGSDFCVTSTFNMSVCLSDLFNSNLQTIFYTIRLCFKNNISNSLMLVDVLRRAFKLFKECLEEMKNKCCLLKRKHCWSATIIHYTNTIEDLLRESTKKSGWDYLRNCCQELISEIIKSDFEIPFERKRLVILFQRWHYANMKLQDFRESLFVSAVYLSAYPSDVEEALGLWLETKMQIYDEKIEDVTIGDILESESDKIKAICPNFDLRNQNLKSLLLKELKAYNSCSFSNFRKTSLLYDSVNRIWSQLQKLNLEIHEKALLLNCVIDMTVNSGDLDSISYYQNECEQLVELLMKKEKKVNPRNLFYAGNLKFSLFQLNLKSIQESENALKSDDAVLDYLKKEEDEKAKFGEEIDLNLTCNILPSSNNLNVELEEKYLSALNGIVEIWQKAAKYVSKSSLEDEEIKSWLYNVKQVAYMYQLVGDYHQGLLTWILYYKIGKIFDDSSAQLLGITYVLEECTHVDNCNLLQEAEAMAEEMATDEKKREIVLKYWLTVASLHLKKRNDFDCFRYIFKAKTLLESLKKVVNIYIYNAKFWCLTCNFICLFPEYGKDFQLNDAADVRVIINKAFGFINSGIKNEASKSFSQTEYTELMLTLIETSMLAVEYFGFYQQTNYMRLFLDDLYQIAQKLVLPTRTSEILIKLAQVDILCEKFEDCQEKLNKLKSILMIDSIKCIEPESSNNEYLKIPKTHPEEAISPRALSPVRFVDKDTKYRERDISPCFTDAKFKSRNHSRKCECVLCRNILIQLLTIDTLTVEGQYHARKSQLKKAYYCYRSGYDHLKRLEWNQFNQTQKLTGEINSNMKQFTGNLDFKIDVIRFHSAKFLINYAYFELSPGVKGDVAMDVFKLIERIGLTLENLSFEENLLKWVFTEVTLTALVMAEMKTKKMVSSPVFNSRSEAVSVSTPTATPAVSRVSRKNLAPNKYKDTKSTKTPRDLKTKGRKVLDDSDEEEEAKKKEPDVSVDLFESFEEKLKLSQEPEKKKKVLRQKSESVEIIEVKRVGTRSQNKK